MAKFKTYGAEFSFPDRYAAGYALNEHEAGALNGHMAELISHKVRNGPFKDVKAGETPSAEQLAAANALVEKEAAEFQFNAATLRGPSAPKLTPLQKIAREEATREIKARVLASETFDSIQTAKSAAAGETPGEKVYPRERFDELVNQFSEHEAIVAKAKKILAAREGKGANELAITI